MSEVASKDVRLFTFTLWDNLYAVSGSLQSAPWKDWESSWDSIVPTRLKKSKLPCVVLGKMVEGARRNNKNVLTIEALALDIERKNLERAEYEARLERVIEKLTPYEYIAYTTYSHTPEDPRLRIILPLAEPLEPKQYKAAMSYLNCLTGAIADMSAQKISQPVVLPFCPADSQGNHNLVQNKGVLLDPSSDMAKEVISMRRALGEGHGRAPQIAVTRQACKNVLLGRPYAQEGARDTTALHIVWHLAKTHREPTEEAVGLVFDWSTWAMGDDAPSLENIYSKFARGVDKLEQEGVPITDDPYEESGLPENEPAIIQYKSAFYMRKKDGVYSREHTREEWDLAVKCHLLPYLPVTYTDEATGKRKWKSQASLLRQYGVIAEKSLIDLTIARSTYDVNSRTFRSASVSWPGDLEPRYHVKIDKWLSLLGGEKLKDWLALFSDLSRPLSALVVIGPKNTGKTLLARGCASRFGGTYANQEALTGRFQEALITNPLVYVDEDVEDNQYDKSFLSSIRSELSTHERNINRKFLPPVPARGCIRCIISANHLPFKSKNSQNADDLAAIAERFFWVKASKEASQFLESLPFEEKNEWGRRELAEHIMHLETSREVERESRFGITGDSDELANLINMSVRWNSWVTEWICNGLRDRFSKLSAGDQDVKQGAVIFDGHVYVRVRTVVKAWERYLQNNSTAPDTRLIAEAVRGIAYEGTSKPREIGVEQGNNQTRYYKIKTSVLTAWTDVHHGDGEGDVLRTVLAGDAKVIPLTTGSAL